MFSISFLSRFFWTKIPTVKVMMLQPKKNTLNPKSQFVDIV